MNGAVEFGVLHEDVALPKQGRGKGIEGVEFQLG